MIVAFLLIAVTVVLFGPVPLVLERSRWTAGAPRSAVVLWQAIGLAGCLAAIGSGLAVAVAPLHVTIPGGVIHLVHGVLVGHPLAGLGLYEALGLTVAADVSFVLAAGLAVTLVRTLRARSRHRRVLDLVGAPDLIGGAVVVDHRHPVAYCLPGLRSRIVLSAGALTALQGDELGAVLAHERGHAHARHDLVMLPIASMVDLLRWMPYARIAPRAVRVLLEMAADDFASRDHGRRTVARALVKLADAGTGPVPACGFAASDPAVVVRVRRLLDGRARSPAACIAAVASAGLTLLLPLVTAVLPLVR